ncbi:Gmh1p NDAI_0B05140 [Naumovozyma dairenensis CBS 421]|uniref:UNC-50 family protein n=1 Tax=Naumovozyma dairenensis (strain ATCC 10597 / BCRC 20456 / CBS 421 / NBRC 0211 / NRRL Y-12639) TaxID=1071378 RepID=G0W6Y6_NAUDC|nr:hypothetical protein NDAI_0B05140 [Naumovozyma dairenensis CBS 421]CCD23547.1 hypothetical protein NDAI_0B05140 [Naumovozyma dairenensis CBS 421]
MSVLPRTVQDVNPTQNRKSISVMNSNNDAYDYNHYNNSTFSNNNRIPIVIKRLFKTPKNLDFETATWEMFHLIFKPRKAFRSFYYQHQTKNQWARDDPSFFLLQILLLSITSIAWSIAYGRSFMGFCKLLFNMIFIDFFLLGFIISTMFWFILNRPFFQFKLMTNNDYYNSNNVNNSTRPSIEWGYCFDVHCDAFLVILLLLYFLQFLLLPIINLHNWFALIVGNSLYCFAIGHYFILTFYGYSQLPFLKNINFILLPTLGMALLYVISLIGIDLSSWLSFYNYTN